MEKKCRNILITGATGFVGQALVAWFLNKTSHNLFLVSISKDFKCQGAKVFYGDLTDKKFCHRILKKIDVVYYLAGYKRNILHHTQRPFDFLCGNVNPFLVFLKELAVSKVNKIIYLSSVLADLDYKQSNVDGYALGKYINELLLKSFADQFGLSYTIIRSAPIYGPGDNFDPSTANFIPALIGRIFKARDELLMWGNGKRKMQFIYIDDLVRSLAAAGERVGAFYTFGNPEVCSTKEIASKVIRLANKKIKIKFNLTKPNKPTRLFDFKNIIKPKISLNIGLQNTINYFRYLS